MAFIDGVAYVVEGKVAHGQGEPPVGHHANIFFTYMQVIVTVSIECKCMCGGSVGQMCMCPMDWQQSHAFTHNAPVHC
jgi:hypothetical protein